VLAHARHCGFWGMMNMTDLSPTDDGRPDGDHSKFTRLTADDFRQAATTGQEQRAAICRYFRRGAAAGYATGELVDFLGVSSPSILDMAGYPDEAAACVMETLADITDEEIQSTIF
jgi:hypothetical protein